MTVELIITKLIFKVGGNQTLETFSSIISIIPEEDKAHKYKDEWLLWMHMPATQYLTQKNQVLSAQMLHRDRQISNRYLF